MILTWKIISVTVGAGFLGPHLCEASSLEQGLNKTIAYFDTVLSEYRPESWLSACGLLEPDFSWAG